MKYRPYGKIVLANGCFRRLHYGHLLHLKQAKELGYLIVSITSDAYIGKPGGPFYPQEQRAALVGALKCVDEVLVVDSLLEALAVIHPDILIKGIDYQNGLDAEHNAYCKSHDIEIRFTTTPKMNADELGRR